LSAFIGYHDRLSFVTRQEKKEYFYPDGVHADHLFGRYWEMGLFDDLGKALKKVEEDVKNSDLDKHLKNVEQGLNKAGKDISAEIDKARAPAQPATPSVAAPAAAPVAGTPAGKPVSRSPHPGYAKIAAWMKRNYKDRITGSGNSLQKGLELEQLTAEACSGLSAKAKKGFMDYLKKQNYEPLLK
jgi:hypothetical protein